MASAHPLIDHDEIRAWAEARDAQPACVKRTGGKGDPGMIRLDFPGFSGKQSLAPISWDAWFMSFDDNGLALLVQDETARGQQSNFNKLVSRGAIENGRSSRGRSTGARKTGRAANRARTTRTSSSRTPSSRTPASRTTGAKKRSARGSSRRTATGSAKRSATSAQKRSGTAAKRTSSRSRTSTRARRK